MEWSKDVGAAQWILERLLPSGAEAVGGFVPDLFDAYVRVLHPWRGPIKLRWSQLATEAGVALGHATQREELESTAASHGAELPMIGTLERDELDALVDLVARFTSTPEACWFGIWEGYGWMTPAAPAGPRVEIPGRSLALFTGPIEAASTFMGFPRHQSPNLWWPGDHA